MLVVETPQIEDRPREECVGTAVGRIEPLESFDCSRGAQQSHEAARLKGFMDQPTCSFTNYLLFDV